MATARVTQSISDDMHALAMRAGKRRLTCVFCREILPMAGALNKGPENASEDDATALEPGKM